MPWNIATAIAHLKTHAKDKSMGKCASHTREAIEAGGLVLPRTKEAKDYGTKLLATGFTELDSARTTSYQQGDVVIIQGFTENPHGHMAMFDGTKWISDFVQSGLYPGSGYRQNKPTYKIYRFANQASP